MSTTSYGSQAPSSHVLTPQFAVVAGGSVGATAAAAYISSFFLLSDLSGRVGDGDVRRGHRGHGHRRPVGQPRTAGLRGLGPQDGALRDRLRRARRHRLEAPHQPAALLSGLALAWAAKSA